MIEILRIMAVFCTAIVVGKLISKIKLPAILGWLLTGMLFGPYLAGIVSVETLDTKTYQIFIKVFECFAGIMIGGEIVFKKLKQSGSKIIVITLFQSLGTFAIVTGVFAIVFVIAKIPIYLSVIFGGIALATAPAPAISIVNEYKTNGPVTKTLVPMAALDDIVGVIVFFTVISIVSSQIGESNVSALNIVLMIFLPFVIGIIVGCVCGLLLKKVKSTRFSLVLMILFLGLSITLGLVCDRFIFKIFSINYLLIGMAFSAAMVNLLPSNKVEKILKLYNPILTLSLIIVIVNLGMPLNYRLIAEAGLFAAIYIISRAVGKIGSAFVGGVIMKAEPTVKKFLGLTLLPHSGVSLVFTGIAVSTLSGVDGESAILIQGTIAAAAIINEIISVILAKQAFKWAGELNKVG